MILYEFDADGWLVGWHDDPGRPNSTAVAPLDVPPSTARWNGAKWMEDASRAIGETQAAAQSDAVRAVQSRLDSLAQAWGYDSILSLCTYASSAVARFRAEGQAGVDWRDATWAAVDQNRGAKTMDELMRALPAEPARPVS